MILVTSAAEAAAIDAAVIESGVPSRALMQRAGAAAAGEIARRLGDRARRGIAIFAGPGNNGGDAWVVARALASTGVAVRVSEVLPVKTDDSRAERELALSCIERNEPTGSEAVVVDGLLGTGSSGVPRGPVADAIGRIGGMRERGATVVALDIPSGLDATTGAATGSVLADLTLTFGTLKRGLLTAREQCGRIVVLDIGLEAHRRGMSSTPKLVDSRFVTREMPAIPAPAHKGTRKKLAIAGGAPGMAGAAILAARSAMRSGIGMVRLLVAPESIVAVQAAVPEAVARPWPTDEAAIVREVLEWADGLLIGPGLGVSGDTRALVASLLDCWRGAVVLDADALNVFEGEPDALGARLSGRPALITPHAAELARLAACPVSEVLDRRYEIGGTLARRLGATVLLKGVPTVVTSARGEALVSAAGTQALAQAGSGDLLSGIAATLLTQTGEPLRSGACAAWVHGRAAELAARTRNTRGIPLGRITAAVGRVWGVGDSRPDYPVLTELPSLVELAPSVHA